MLLKIVIYKLSRYDCGCHALCMVWLCSRLCLSICRWDPGLESTVLEKKTERLTFSHDEIHDELIRDKICLQNQPLDRTFHRWGPYMDGAFFGQIKHQDGPWPNLQHISWGWIVPWQKLWRFGLGQYGSLGFRAWDKNYDGLACRNEQNIACNRAFGPHTTERWKLTKRHRSVTLLGTKSWASWWRRHRPPHFL
jgi:hypothetical protein